MNDNKKILMLASENDALVGGKVGGIGDVVRDIPIALADLGCSVDVVTPAYQRFSKLPSAELVSSIKMHFAGQVQMAGLYKVPPKTAHKAVNHWAIELPQKFYANSNSIYFNDPATTPFATDATKFACFCLAAATALVNGDLIKPGVIHLHDWHSAFFLLLRNSETVFSSLQSIPCVYTIHNLALQGIRPIRDNDSALESWFPGLDYPTELIVDPRAQHCVNPMRVGINMADKIHVVSPTYADEILSPSEPDCGFIGGEGLEMDIARAKSKGKLVGILNGCVYPDKHYQKLTKKELIQVLNTEILSLITKRPEVDSALYTAQKRVKAWSAKRATSILITSVGRITNQKIAILQHKTPSGKSALEALLLELGDDGVFILLGSGDRELEQFLTGATGYHDNFIFIKGYSENLSEVLYQSGDLFLMPSSFEPCGISQMLAMRAGQPCLVHAVGGLKDTVQNDVNGFSFTGDSVAEQAANLLQRFSEVKRLRQQNADKFQSIADNARNERYLWETSARLYISSLYQF